MWCQPVPVASSINATSLLLGLGMAQAALTYQPALQNFEALSKAKDKEFKGMKEAEVNRLREEFSNQSQAALSAAKTEYAALSRGKTDQQMDKLLWERAEKAGVAGKIKADIDAMGGPAKVMKQSDRVVAEFVREVLDESRPKAKVSLAETVVTSLVMAQPAHARWSGFRRGGCYLFWFTVSVGYATDVAHKSCDR